VDLEESTRELDLDGSERYYVEAAVNTLMKIKF
jgi:hypothetical protein